MCSGLHADTEIGRYTQMHSDTQRRMQATMEGGKEGMEVPREVPSVCNMGGE